MRAGFGTRLISACVFALLGWQAGSLLGEGSHQPRNAVLGIAIGAVCGFAGAPYVLERPYRSLRLHLGHIPISELLTCLFGLVLGLLVAVLLAYPLSFLPWSLGHLLPGLAAVACGYLGVSVSRMRHLDLVQFVRDRVGSGDLEVQGQDSGFLVDTSTIIDGRVADIAGTGFLTGTLIVPRFVLNELQRIADSSDPLRRNRGKRGLDMLTRLQADTTISLTIIDDDPRDVPDVDGKLVQLARMSHCAVITNDFNLNRVAELQGVRVLNINELANAVKPVVHPGEEMRIRIIQEGREYNQGVAYLDDGTMIVVEGGKRLLDQYAEVVVTRVLQTAAGKMIFAHPKTGRVL